MPVFKIETMSIDAIRIGEPGWEEDNEIVADDARTAIGHTIMMGLNGCFIGAVNQTITGVKKHFHSIHWTDEAGLLKYVQRISIRE